ncbi:Endonuclease/exonuclease/phosphatase [Hyaloraphidium curvatum]|nr:Endonuclease/exonuclease/phosphatase [Hyaloraphidium curvatum]
MDPGGRGPLFGHAPKRRRSDPPSPGSPAARTRPRTSLPDPDPVSPAWWDDNAGSSPRDGSPPARPGPSSLPHSEAPAAAPALGPERELRIVSWNINGLRQFAAKLAAKLKRRTRSDVLADWFSRVRADIVCFQETKVPEPAELPDDLLSVPGYDCFWCLPEDGKPFSGTATYAKKGLTRAAWAGFGKGPMDKEEGRAVMTDHGDFLLINIYAPCTIRQERREYKQKWMGLLVERVKELRAEGKRVIVVGDFNIAHTSLDVFRPKAYTSPAKNRNIDLLHTAGMVDAWRDLNPGRTAVYTYFSRGTNKKASNSGWRIDLFLVDEDTYRERVLDADIMSHFTTWDHGDHCPITLTLSFPTPAPQFPTPPEARNRPRREAKGLSDALAEAYALAAVSDPEPASVVPSVQRSGRTWRDPEPEEPRRASAPPAINLESQESENDARGGSQHSAPSSAAPAPARAAAPAQLYKPPDRTKGPHYKPDLGTQVWTREESEKRWDTLLRLGIPPPKR